MIARVGFFINTGWKISPTKFLKPPIRLVRKFITASESPMPGMRIRAWGLYFVWTSHEAFPIYDLSGALFFRCRQALRGAVSVSRIIPHNPASALAMPFPPCVACGFFDLPIELEWPHCGFRASGACARFLIEHQIRFGVDKIIAKIDENGCRQVNNGSV